MAKNQ